MVFWGQKDRILRGFVPKRSFLCWWMRKNTPKRSSLVPRGSKKGVKTAAHMYHPSYREYPLPPPYIQSNTANGSSLGQHVLNGYGSMNTIYGKRDPALVDMWGTSYQNMKYQSSLRRRVITGGSEKTVRVSRRMDCRIAVIKFYVSANN